MKDYGFNRTFLVLKQAAQGLVRHAYRGFNRTFLVLKLQVMDLDGPGFLVLIAPFWY